MALIDLVAYREREAQGLITCRPHPTADLLIWNYTARCQFERAWDEVTMQARGLITHSDGTIVARPFQKFFNIEEHQGPLPLELFTVTEKMDGSLGLLYFIGSTPYIATRGSFVSEQAVKGTALLHEKYGAVLSFLQPGLTYLFEIVYPANRIVVDYGKREELVLLAVIDTESGEELDIHDRAAFPLPGFPVVRRYDGLTDLAALRSREADNQEGFVIRFASGLRLKAKFAEYVRLHRLITGINARAIWELLRCGQPFDDLLTRVPDEFYQWVITTRDGLLSGFREVEATSRQLYREVAGLPTRKKQAELVVGTPYAAVVFRLLDGKDYAEVIWKQLRPVAEKPFREDSDV